MIYVDINKLQLPAKLRGKLEETTAQLISLPPTERKAFIAKHSRLWRLVKPYLTAIVGQNGRDPKCWYCETKAERFDFHVDHFRPKGRVLNKGCQAEEGYWWLAFDFNNYRLSCAYCNSPHPDDEGDEAKGKRDQFPLGDNSTRAKDPGDNLDDEKILLIDPTKPGDPGLLAFSDDGRVYPRYPEDTFIGKKAKVSIEVLNLNDIAIEEIRKTFWRKCEEKVARGKIEFTQYKRTGSQSAKKAFDTICEEIVELVSPSAKYSAMARYCFRGTGEDWVLSLL